MAELVVSIRHVPVEYDQTCGVCGAAFVAAEDSGSRVLGVKSGAQDFAFLMCGGCHSKWVHGAVTRIRSLPAVAERS